MRALAYVLPVVLAVSLPAAAAPPQVDLKAWTGKMIAALDKGEPEAINDLLDKKQQPDFAGFASAPDLLLPLTRSLALNAPTLGGLGVELSKWAVNVAAGEKSEGGDAGGDMGGDAGGAPAAPPKESSVQQRAAAAAYASLARCALAHEGTIKPAAWLKIADLTLASYQGQAVADGGEAAAFAMDWMRDAMHAKDIDAAAVTAKVADLEKLADAQPAGPFPAAVKGGAKLLRLEASLRETPPPAPAALKAPLDDLFKLLSPLAKPGGNALVGTVYNDAVTIAKGNKVPGISAQYWLGPKTPSLSLTWQLPFSSHWRTRGAPQGPEKERFVGAFQELGPGGRVIREGYVEVFRWNFNYEFANGKAAGDAPKDLARADKATRQPAFAKTTLDKELTKGPFSKGMSTGEYYEMAGSDSADQPLHVRVFFVRGKESKVTFAISITDHATMPPGDPEIEAVSATFAEVKAR